MTPTANDFRRALNQILSNARQKGLEYIVVNAGELHRLVGGYPGSNHRMPVCCSVMRSMMNHSDCIIDEPPSGQGASLTIKYFL